MTVNEIYKAAGRLHGLYSPGLNKAGIMYAALNARLTVAEDIAFSGSDLSEEDAELASRLTAIIKENPIPEGKPTAEMMGAFSDGYQNVPPLRKIRLSQHITQQGLAERMNVNQQTIARWEAGSYPRPGTLKKLAKILNCHMEDLVEDEY